MLSMSLKTLNIILMCFDGKNNCLKKKRKYSNSNNKGMSKVLKIDFVLSNHEIQFLHPLVNSKFLCYCSRLTYNLFIFVIHVNACTALNEFVKIITTLSF